MPLLYPLSRAAHLGPYANGFGMYARMPRLYANTP
jgi:hypothetical protein